MAATPKQYIFSQWPYQKKQSPGATGFRMGYTVRTADGYRLTQYVQYSVLLRRGTWPASVDQQDLELYNYSSDPDETINQAGNPALLGVLTRLKAVLKAQYAPTE